MFSDALRLLGALGLYAKVRLSCSPFLVDSTQHTLPNTRTYDGIAAFYAMTAVPRPWVGIPEKAWMFVYVLYLCGMGHSKYSANRNSRRKRVEKPLDHPPSNLGWNGAKTFCHLHGTDVI
ncbi:hypothetical protein TNCV_1305491 [Trichonephila clavipes]|nr:hypothetical protein TNCV_1305491 [Trichonephila clavipes]